MAYQLSTLVSKVQTNKVRDTGVSASEVADAINDEIRSIADEYPDLRFFKGSQTYTVTIGVSDLTDGDGLPADYGEAIKLINTTSGQEGKLLYISEDDLDELYPDHSDTSRYPNGQPLYWYSDGSTIRLFPAPAAGDTYKLRYRKLVTDLTADGDVPVLPRNWEECIVEGASARIFQNKDMYAEAGIHLNQRDKLLQALVVRAMPDQVGDVHIMPVNRGRIVRPSSVRWR